MPSATICKQFSFHAAHRLPNHQGQCQRLHGHSYVLEVLVTGQVKQAGRTESDEGMVLDFADLKKIYKDWIEPLVEHQYLNERLTHDELRIVKNVDYSWPSFPQLPQAPNGEPLTTCENLAEWMRQIFQTKLSEKYQPSSMNLPVVSIRLWETPTSYAEVGKLWRD